jgi:hypothetical protein
MSITGGSTSIQDSTFSNAANTPITIIFLNSAFSIKNSNIKDVKGGPAVLLANTAYQAASFLSLDGVRIERVTAPPTSASAGLLIQFANLSIQNSIFDTLQGSVAAYLYVSGSATSIENVELYRGQSSAYSVVFASSTVTSKFLKTDDNILDGAVIYFSMCSASLTDTTILRIRSRNQLDPSSFSLGVVYSKAIAVKRLKVADTGYQYPVISIDTSTACTLDDLLLENFVGNQTVTVWKSSCSTNNFRALNIQTKYLFNPRSDASYTVVNASFTGTVQEAIGLCSFNSVMLLTGLVIDSSATVGSLIKVRESVVEFDSVSVTGAKMNYLASSFKSRVSIANSSFKDLTSNFGSLDKTALTLKAVEFATVKVPTTFMKVTNSQVSLIQVSFKDFETQDTLFRVTEESSFSMSACNLQRITSYEETMVDAESSRVQIDDSTVSNFTAGFITVTNSEVSFNNSKVELRELRSSDILYQHSGGALASFDSNVTLTQSTFRQLAAVKGGALYSSCTSVCTAQIQYCGFYDNSAAEGGALNVLNTSLTISSSIFANNTASQGGGLDISCYAQECLATIRNSQFVNNSAVNGGAVSWRKLKPNLQYNAFVNNSAAYGPDSASYAYSLEVLSANYEGTLIVEASGQRLQQPLVLGLMDVEGQLMSSPSQKTAEILSTDSFKTSGQAIQTAELGLFNFSSIAFIGPINSTFELTAASSAIAYDAIDINTKELPPTLRVEVFLRPCQAGEVSQESKCVVCSAYTYSLDPQDTKCSICASHASCPGGSVLDLDQGHWRPDTLSKDIYPCHVPDACDGGVNSTCNDGYGDRLCSVCDSGWERLGLYNCQECLSLAGQAAKFLVSILVVQGAFCLMMRGFAKGSPVYPVVLRLCLNYIQLMSFLLTFNISWPESVLKLLEAIKIVGTLSQTSSSSDCLLDVAASSAAYVRLILACAYPIALALVSALVLSAWARCTKSAFFKPWFVFNLAAGVVLSPYVIEASFLFLSCRQMEGETHWLVYDYSIQCYTSTHLQFILGVALPSLLFWLLAFPALLLRAIKKETASAPSTALSFLVYGVKTKWWLFTELMLKNFIMCTSVLLAKYDYEAQLLTGIFLLMILISLQFLIQPFTDKLVRLVDFLCLLSVFVCLASTYYCIASRSTSDIPIQVIIFTQTGLVFAMMLFTTSLKGLPSILTTTRASRYEVANPNFQSEIG